jgi:hypothetical protein
VGISVSIREGDAVLGAYFRFFATRLITKKVPGANSVICSTQIIPDTFIFIQIYRWVGDSLVHAKISNFTLHNAGGESVLSSELIGWALKAQWPFNVASYSWTVDGEPFSHTKDSFWEELPDASGFICFESGFKPDNCYILDAYGKLRYRLHVPWELTGYEVPHGAKMWFRNVGTHNDGQFGVTAWVEYAGDFYFELDYHEGRFLWGREIRF